MTMELNHPIRTEGRRELLTARLIQAGASIALGVMLAANILGVAGLVPGSPVTAWMVVAVVIVVVAQRVSARMDERSWDWVPGGAVKRSMDPVWLRWLGSAPLLAAFLIIVAASATASGAPALLGDAASISINSDGGYHALIAISSGGTLAMSITFALIMLAADGIVELVTFARSTDARIRAEGAASRTVRITEAVIAVGTAVAVSALLGATPFQFAIAAAAAVAFAPAATALVRRIRDRRA